MDLLGGIKKALNAPKEVGKAMTPPQPDTPPDADPTGAKAAKARGDAAKQEAIDRGKTINTPTGELKKKAF